MSKETRRIWARGLTRSNRNAAIYGKDGQFLGVLQSVEHFSESSVLTLIHTIDVPHNVELEVRDA